MIKYFIFSFLAFGYYALKTIVEYQNNGYELNFYGFITVAWLALSAWTLVDYFKEKKIEKEETENE